MNDEQLDLIPREKPSLIEREQPQAVAYVPSGALCVRGNGIWLYHDWPVRQGPCKRCGREFPKQPQR